MSKRTSLGDHQQATTAADVPERKHPETKQSVTLEKQCSQEKRKNMKSQKTSKMVDFYI
jgi:hypothetical protein